MTVNHDRAWWVYSIQHCEDNGGETADRYSVAFAAEYRPEGDEDGAYADYAYGYLGMSAFPTHPQYGFSQFGDVWEWKEDDPQTVAFRNLPRNIQQHFILRMLDDAASSKTTSIVFEDEMSVEIFPAEYGIDIREYLYRGGASMKQVLIQRGTLNIHEGTNAFYLYGKDPSGDDVCLACLGDGVDGFWRVEGYDPNQDLDLPEAYVFQLVDLNNGEEQI
jgi:hypothetical protein